jgi:hypothetical protein
LLSFRNSWSEMMVPFVSVRSGPASVRAPPFMLSTFWAAAMIVGSSPSRAEVLVLFSVPPGGPPWMSNRLPPVTPVLPVNFVSGPARVTMPVGETRKKDPCVVRDSLRKVKSGSGEVLLKTPSKFLKLARSCCCGGGELEI